MIKLAIVRQALSETVVQSGYLFALIVETGLFLVLFLGVELQYQGHALVSCTLFGKTVEGQELFSLSRELVPTVSGFILAGLMFLFILTAAYVSMRTVNHPLLPVMLVRRVSRAELYVSNATGVFLAVTLNVMCFSLCIGVALLLQGMEFAAFVVRAAFSFSLEFLALSSFAMLLTTLTSNSFTSALLTLGIYFVLSPLLSMDTQRVNIVLKLVGHAFPIIGDVTAQTRSLLLESSFAYYPCVKAVVYSIAYTVAGVFVFHRRDLS